MSFSKCCVTGFKWDGVPEGREGMLGDNKSYITGDSEDVAVMVIHDLFGWTFSNLRLLSDHYAKEADATVYLPDFFDGEVLPSDILAPGPKNWDGLDVPGFISRNTKEIRETEIFACARALRAQYKRVAVIGFCYGGWAVFRLGDKANDGLVDCISTAHPSWLTKEEIQNVGVPVQIMAPEHDESFTPELKEFANKVIPTLGVPYEYQYFPGQEHAFATRGWPEEKKGMERAKNCAVNWFRQWLRAS